MSLLYTTHSLIRDARDALMRGKPNVEDALAFLDRAEAEEIAGRRASDHHWKIDMIDHARRELTAKPPRPHHALALLDNLVSRVTDATKIRIPQLMILPPQIGARP